MYNIGNNIINTKNIIILLREYCIRSTKNSCHVKIEGTLHNCFPGLFLLWTCGYNYRCLISILLQKYTSNGQRAELYNPETAVQWINMA